MNKKSEALRLADDLRQGHFEMATFAADELCRLSAENAELLGALHKVVDRCINAPGAGQYSTLEVIESTARAAIAKAGGEA